MSVRIVADGEIANPGDVPLTMVSNFKFDFSVDGSDHSCAINARLMALCCLRIQDSAMFEALRESVRYGETSAVDLALLDIADDYLAALLAGVGREELKEIYLRFTDQYIWDFTVNSIFNDASKSNFSVSTEGGVFQTYQYQKETDGPILAEDLVPTVRKLSSMYPDCSYFIVTVVYRLPNDVYAAHDFLIVKRGNVWIWFDDCGRLTGEVIPC